MSHLFLFVSASIPFISMGYAGYAPQGYGFQEAYAETQRRQAAELRVLEEELRRARGEAWPLPASCIEQEAPREP